MSNSKNKKIISTTWIIEATASYDREACEKRGKLATMTWRLDTLNIKWSESEDCLEHHSFGMVVASLSKIVTNRCVVFPSAFRPGCTLFFWLILALYVWLYSDATFQLYIARRVDGHSLLNYSNVGDPYRKRGRTHFGNMSYIICFLRLLIERLHWEA